MANKLQEKLSSKIADVTANSVEMGSFRDELKKVNHDIIDNKTVKNGRKKSEKENRTKRINLVIQPSLYEKLEQACEKTGRNISNYVAEAVKKAIEQDLSY